jgi:F-type H+-transporting ATPase subunit c
MENGIFYAKAAAYFGSAFAIGIGCFGPAIAMGMIGMKACENVGKYAESSGKIRATMILSMALVETTALYCLIIAGMLIFLNS